MVTEQSLNAPRVPMVTEQSLNAPRVLMVTEQSLNAPREPYAHSHAPSVQVPSVQNSLCLLFAGTVASCPVCCSDVTSVRRALRRETDVKRKPIKRKVEGDWQKDLSNEVLD
ncbi:hypothetical protein EYF80_043879 [Liparis tanakae]|uniref:Uncharacterized protein n=1 Tax=Liparis tanakae TaxID=230148 RepID=A0A4Z2FYF6_9TELE|nr:hypothetical protein EYF80_043879 [Liparis tanakae]